MKNFYLFFSLFLFLIVGISINGLSVSAYPYPVQVKQPNGTTITVILKGDEKVKWAQTLDGYTVLRNSKGVFEYASLNASGDLNPSGIAVRDISSRKADELNFLAKVQKGIFYSKSQVSLMKSIYEVKSAETQKVFPTTGARKLICILMGYTDKTFTKTQAEFNNLFNQVGYTTGGATGSVKDFYNESSYNQFDLTVTVAGPYTAANNMAYYGANDAYGYDINPRALVSEAINAADASVNFADFDNDGDGTVDGVYVIFAGYGEEAGASANTIWSHAWSLASPVIKDGKSISKYSCSPELRGNSGSTITTIGVICHEFGHVLGSPDFYDTNYSVGGQFVGTGNWDVMAGGSWNNYGITPAQHTVYTKVKVYGWATATVLNEASNITVNQAQANKSFYQINSTTSGEYWIIENRQQVGFDTYIPGHGLLIYHVHKDIGIAGNAINATYPQKMYPVCANATTNPGSTASTYGTINGSGCPFPGSGAKTSFTDTTTPWMKSWAGGNTAKPITTIVENTSNKTITFRFMGGAPALSITGSTSELCNGNSRTFSTTNYSNATYQWSAGSGLSLGNTTSSTVTATATPYNGSATITLTRIMTLNGLQVTQSTSKTFWVGIPTTPTTIIGFSYNGMEFAGNAQYEFESRYSGTSNWSVGGGTILNGQGTYAITVLTAPSSETITKYFDVSVRSTNSCGSSAWLWRTGYIVPGIGPELVRGNSENQNNKFAIENTSIYPNPTNGSLNIELPKSINENSLFEIKVFDVLGKLVLTKSSISGNSKQSIDLSQYNSGNYIIIISNSEGLVEKQLINLSK